MTIQEYIQEHKLTLASEQPSPAMGSSVLPQLMDCPGAGLNSQPDRYQIYSDEAGYRSVSLNLTRKKFRIVLLEPVLVLSDWHDSDGSYEPAVSSTM